ncbi:hypothetical protein SAMD00019534_002410 [Acytostelium subglobosum LB1]|uniref:hypothetical protein n=1 Tax=Acytostelium subglobosum LB1 TaxID=1410327 RepID=UPI000644BC85|nr:hypothetical protein SAMD00019534_002410 [Acytostelium subglobosum LB1]GAM17066.1 hypothetical protein SAMD00019534_002410 [Acytostelium subglobosum LB1]|eukprot:XP_012759128.1 hypothetical protein SAMD00019534_002410 [Acytostelium subglobosum LB1]
MIVVDQEVKSQKYACHLNIYKTALPPILAKRILDNEQCFGRTAEEKAKNRWESCPYFFRAMANLQDIESFKLPRPSFIVVEDMASGLQNLLKRRLEGMSFYSIPIHFDQLLQLSSYIVTFCNEPETLVNLNAPPRHWLVDSSMARFLLQAIEEDYIRPIDFTYDDIVMIIANSLFMTTSKVYRAHPYYISTPPVSNDMATQRKRCAL